MVLHVGVAVDVFAEADRIVDFTRFFTHSGTKEVRSREQLRPLLILDLFAEGTNMGIKRVAAANDRYGYDELLYVRKTYFSPEALRNANGAVVNKLLSIRNPQLWGEGASSCASDGTKFESWKQNLMTQWRSRYKGYGVMVYWHVETNAVCIYAQTEELLQLRGGRHDRGTRAPRHGDACREELRGLAMASRRWRLPFATCSAWCGSCRGLSASSTSACIGRGKGRRGLPEPGRHVRPADSMGIGSSSNTTR